nr:immunoglobulin light chain junction region [Macaca mulatta]
CQQYNNFPPTF